MKKTLALLLAVLVALSMFSVATFAADEESTETSLVTITFVNDGKTIHTIEVKEGTILTPHVPANPSKPATDKVEYIFRGWKGTDGELYQHNTLPKATENVTYVAVYAEQEIVVIQTFWNFIESIFARINLIFQYFAEIFRFDQ